MALLLAWNVRFNDDIILLQLQLLTPTPALTITPTGDKTANGLVSHLILTVALLLLYCLLDQ